ncbi:MAG: primosomal protein N' [Coriobacteriia bacterium]|nr:primosomal protein N' [Coriobacteriia bacterium]
MNAENMTFFNQQTEMPHVVQVVIALATRALDEPFTYLVPNGMNPQVGDAVIVELNKKQVLGFVVRLNEHSAEDESLELKPILAHISGPFFTEQSYELATWVARYYAAPLSESLSLFLPKGLMTRLKKALSSYLNTGAAKMPVRRAIKSDLRKATLKDAHLKPKKLSKGQQEALEAILEAVTKPILLDGVTGSGKTEVYLQAIETARKSGKSAILLVPEISLTPQTVGRIRSRFGDDVAVLHSGLSDGERYAQWEKARKSACGVVVGARSALFAPLSNLGLVIIDEEHDNSYKQGQSPRYHAREVAQKLCDLTGAQLVLGSATPSMESLYAAEQGKYISIKLPERVNSQPLPKVKIVDLSKEFAHGNKSMFSTCLMDALRQVREREEKAILLLNRRGFANFMLCRECGYVPGCEHCSTSLTYHAPQNHLRCHQCNCIKPLPANCPSCASPYLKQFGGGVQRVEADFKEALGDWQLIRMDADTTSAKGAHASLLEEFDQCQTGVLLGTQMVAKGHDFPDVTLVGVINADVTLNLPDFRAGERGYQLLEQAAGRAGRGHLPGEVIIQTYNPESLACKAVEAHDSEILLVGERELRRTFGYPPYAALCNIVVSGVDEGKVQKYSERLRKALRASKSLRAMQATLMGPSPCLLAKKSKSYRYHLMIKTGADEHIGPAVQEVLKGLSKTPEIKLSVDVNPTDVF